MGPNYMVQRKMGTANSKTNKKDQNAKTVPKRQSKRLQNSNVNNSKNTWEIKKRKKSKTIKSPKIKKTNKSPKKLSTIRKSPKKQNILKSPKKLSTIRKSPKIPKIPKSPKTKIKSSPIKSNERVLRKKSFAVKINEMRIGQKREKRTENSIKNDSKSKIKFDRRMRQTWTEEETESLVEGVKKHGAGHWSDIVSDSTLTFSPKRTNVDLKDKWKNLLKSGKIGEYEW